MTAEELVHWLETRWKIVVVGLVLFLAVWIAGDVQQWYHDRYVQPAADSIAVFKREASKAVRYADSLQAENTKSRRRERQLQQRIQRLQGLLPDTERLDSLRQVAESLYQATEDSVRALAPVIDAQRTVIKQQDSTIVVQKQLLVTKDSLFAQCDTARGRLQLAVDSTRTVLSNPPEPPKKERFLGLIPMPSRRTSFILGVLSVLAIRL